MVDLIKNDIYNRDINFKIIFGILTNKTKKAGITANLAYHLCFD